MSRRVAPLLAIATSLACCGCGGEDSEGTPGDGDVDVDLGECPDGFDDVRGNVFYVDPATGDDGNDGSAESPWRSIQHVVANLVDCTDQDGTALHEGAPVGAGDTIMLVGRDGHDPVVEITGCYNEDWVTIKAAVLHEPRVSFVHFRGSAYWRIDGLTLSNGEGGTMLRAEDHDTRGPAHHIEIYNSYFTSGDLQTVEDWAERASTGIWLLGADHVTARCNHMVKVGQAFSVFGDHNVVVRNVVEFFSRDGIATGGYWNHFVGNQIYDALDLGDGHHDDFFQSHMGAERDTSSDIEVSHNVFMNRYTDEQPRETWAATQCLSAFEDGPKRRIRIFDNVCKTNHYHGITWVDTDDSVIVNNTVVGGSDWPGLPAGSEEWPDHTWINVEGSRNVVRNNLTTLNLAGGDHNLEVAPDEVDLYFTDWLGLDLSLVETAPAVDAGSAEEAPEDDVLGNPRDAVPDVGAYEWVGP